MATDSDAVEPLTFAAKITPIETLCHRIIERSGGQRYERVSREALQDHVFRGGYLIPGEIEPASEVDYALRILHLLTSARDHRDLDWAKKLAWDAGQLAMEALIEFRWKPDIVLGQAHRAKQRARATAGNETRRDAAARKNEALLVQIRGLRAKHPTYSKRAIAALLVPSTDDDRDKRRRAIDAMRRQIERADNAVKK